MKMAIMAAAFSSALVSEIPYSSATTSYHTVQVGGPERFYREAGPSGEPTVVLLHGHPSTSRMSDRLIPLLPHRQHVIAPDHPSFVHSQGSSPPRCGSTLDLLAEATAALMFSVPGAEGDKRDVPGPNCTSSTQSASHSTSGPEIARLTRDLMARLTAAPR